MNLNKFVLFIYCISCVNCLYAVNKLIKNKHVCDIIKSNTNFRCEIRDKELLIQFKGYIHILSNNQNTIKIKCYQNQRLNFTNFPTLDFSEVKSLNIKGCAIENEIILKNIRNHLNLWKIKNFTLEMESDQSNEIASDFFQCYEYIENLRLSTSKHDQIFNSIFDNNKLLKSLELNVYNLSKLPSNLFMSLTNLKSLIITDKAKGRNQKEESITFSFKGCKSLEKVVISDVMYKVRLNLMFDRVIEIIELKNNLEIIEINSDAFKYARQVRVVNLSNNSIKILNSTIFEWQREIEILDLSRNKMKIIKSTLFMNNKKLKEINLSFNEIHFIER